MRTIVLLSCAGLLTFGWALAGCETQQATDTDPIDTQVREHQTPEDRMQRQQEVRFQREAYKSPSELAR